MLADLRAYEQFIYTLPGRYPEIQHSTGTTHSRTHIIRNWLARTRITNMCRPISNGIASLHLG